MESNSTYISEMNPKDARILLAYAVTQRVLPRLEMAIKHQPKNESWRRYDKIVVTDNETDITSLKQYDHTFPNDIVRCNPWDNPPWSTNREFNLARCRNTSINYMLAHNYDFLIVLDVDAVIKTWPTRLVKTGCSRVEESHGLPVPTDAIGSWFVLSKELLQTARWNEGYTSYGFEDYDFSMCVAQHDHSMFRYNCGITGAHIAHTGTDKYIHAQGMHINSGLWNQRIQERGILGDSRPWVIYYNNVRKDGIMKAAQIKVKHVAHGRKTAKAATVTYEVTNTGTESWNKVQFRANETDNPKFEEQNESIDGLPFLIDALDPGQTAIIKLRVPKEYLKSIRVGVIEPGVLWYATKAGTDKG